MVWWHKCQSLGQLQKSKATVQRLFMNKSVPKISCTSQVHSQYYVLCTSQTFPQQLKSLFRNYLSEGIHNWKQDSHSCYRTSKQLNSLERLNYPYSFLLEHCPYCVKSWVSHFSTQTTLHSYTNNDKPSVLQQGKGFGLVSPHRPFTLAGRVWD